MTLQIFLAISAVLFAFGLAAVLTRSNSIMILAGIELMMGAANLNFIAFWRFSENPGALTGVIFAIFPIALAAAEAAVGVALIIHLQRRFRSVEADDAHDLQG